MNEIQRVIFCNDNLINVHEILPSKRKTAGQAKRNNNKRMNEGAKDVLKWIHKKLNDMIA